MPYVLLCISILTEVVGTTMMKLSEGFTVLAPSVAVVVAYVISFSLFVIVLKTVPLGLAYGIWGGAGTVLTKIIGCVVWGEPVSYTHLDVYKRQDLLDRVIAHRFGDGDFTADDFDIHTLHPFVAG